MRDDIELLCEITNTHFGGLSAIIIKNLLVNGPLPMDRLYHLVLKDKDASNYLTPNSKNNFLTFRNSMMYMVHHLCIVYYEASDLNIESELSKGEKNTVFEVSVDCIISRIRFPLYMHHVGRLLGETSKIILTEVIKHGRISTNVLFSELSDVVEDFEQNLCLLVEYNFINIVNDNDVSINPLDAINNGKKKTLSKVFTDLLFDCSDGGFSGSDEALSELAISQNAESKVFGLETKKRNLRGSRGHFLNKIKDKVLSLNYDALNSSIYSQIIEEMVKNRYNNVISSLIVRVMSDSKGLKKKPGEDGWTIEEISKEISELLELDPNLKEQLEIDDQSKLKTSVLRVIEVLTKHSDEFVSYNLSSVGTTYKLNLPKIKYLVKYKIIYEYIGYKVGDLGSRVWSMMCNPYVLTKSDNIQVPESEIARNSHPESNRNARHSKVFPPFSKQEIKRRAYWDDVTIAERCLLPNNVARSLLYSLGNEKFIRVHHSDTVTIDGISLNLNESTSSVKTSISEPQDSNQSSSQTTKTPISTISQASLSKHGIFYSACPEGTIKEVQQKFYRIILNILTRCRIQSNQILKFEIRSKHLTQIEMEYLEKLSIGLTSLFQNITQIDRILLILTV
ncbi:DNA-directed RNA polymerase III POLR3C [Cryptosporidium felis]|nr:DNA-directed RNA polymerase III POLR3C [Cryptosporidium felis]